MYCSGLTGYLQSQLTTHLNAGRALLMIALASGAELRFDRIDALSMTADEGAAWAAAVKPVSELLKIQPQLDSGKLALYDLLLHYWIVIFGESLCSMRGFSAAIGTISIVLMFAVIRELYAAFVGGAFNTGELAGGFAALMFATNVAFVQSARSTRMYPLMSAAELAQILYFLRAQRRPTPANCILAACFLATAIAANFTALFLVVGESIWIGYLLLARWRRWPGDQLPVAAPAIALVAGIGLLLPFTPAAWAASQTAVGGGALDWIRYQPPLGWFDYVLREGTGNKSLFRLFLVLTAFGIWRHSSKARLIPLFLIATAAGPFAAVAILSILGRPMMVDRYVSLALMMFLGLAAIGAAASRSKIASTLVCILIVWLSARALRHSGGFWVDWRSADDILCVTSTADVRISVVPAYAVNVVRYHLPPHRRALASGLDSRCSNSQILIVSPGNLIPAWYISELSTCYPRLLGRAMRVEVRAR